MRNVVCVIVSSLIMQKAPNLSYIITGSFETLWCKQNMCSTVFPVPKDLKMGR